MSGFSNPVTNAIGTLVRTVLKSVNYVTNVSGWAIFKDGSAEFNNATIRGTLTIGGASPSPRIVFSNTIPPELSTWGTPLGFVFNSVILFYRNATDYFFEGIGTFGGIASYIRGAYSSADNVYVIQRDIDLGGAFDGRIEVRFGSYGLNTYSMYMFTQQTRFFIGDGSFISDDFEAHTDPWHSLALQNGWTGNFHYRLIGSPANCIQIIADSLVAGTKTDGTILGTLPVGWRPAVSCDIFASAFGGVISTGQPVHINVATTGVVTLWGIGTSTNMSVNGEITQTF